jgi:uncharacterized membrane protein
VTLAPLLAASPAVKLHAFAAMAAFALGVVQLSPQGHAPPSCDRLVLGGADAVISISAFWIHELRLWGPLSPIHLLAIFTLAMLPVGVLHARRHHVARHRFVMISIFCGALVIAGLFTFVPGRIMHAVIVGH